MADYKESVIIFNKMKNCFNCDFYHDVNIEDYGNAFIVDCEKVIRRDLVFQKPICPKWRLDNG